MHIYRYAGGVVPTVAKLTTQPIGLVKALPGAAVKSLYAQHDQYYVSQTALLFPFINFVSSHSTENVLSHAIYFV